MFIIVIKTVSVLYKDMLGDPQDNKKDLEYTLWKEKLSEILIKRIR